MLCSTPMDNRGWVLFVMLPIEMPPRVDHSCATLPIDDRDPPYAMVIGGSNHDGSNTGAERFDAELKVRVSLKHDSSC